MWGIASESFGSTYTKNDYLGKKVLSPVPRGVGCVCDVTCWWALRLRYRVLVGFAVLGGCGAAGLVPVVSVPALSLVPAVPAV